MIPLMVGGVAYATETITLSSSSVSSGSEGSVTIMVPSPSYGGHIYYLYDHTGANVSGNSNGVQAGTSIAWTAAGFATGLTPATYTIAAADYNNAGVADIYCGVGKTLSSCESTFENGGASDFGQVPITITTYAPTSTTSTFWLVENVSSTAQDWDVSGWWIMLAEIAWFYFVVYWVVWFLNYY